MNLKSSGPLDQCIQYRGYKRFVQFRSVLFIYGGLPENTLKTSYDRLTVRFPGRVREQFFCNLQELLENLVFVINPVKCFFLFVHLTDRTPAPNLKEYDTKSINIMHLVKNFCRPTPASRMCV